MGRYLRLYLCFMRFAASRALQFRVDFFFRIFMDVAYYAVNVAFFKIIYLHTPSLGGWSEHQALVFIGLYLVVDALHMIIYSTGLWRMPMLINKGSLDAYLTRPVSPLFFTALQDFQPASVINLLMALGILGWGLVHLPGGWSLGQSLGLALLIPLGTWLHFLMVLLFLLPTFWSHASEGFLGGFFVFGRFMERPDRLFHGVARLVITTILPFALIASLPTRLILEPFSATLLLHELAVTALFSCLVLGIWRRALRGYSSASS